MKLEDKANEYAVSKSSSGVFQKAHIDDFIAGAEWQKQQSESEKQELVEMLKEFDKMVRFAYNEDCTLTPFPTRSLLDKSFELIKKHNDGI